MSKSLNNYIGVSEPAIVIFEKVMSMPDALIPRYYELLTDKSMDDIQSLVDEMKEGNKHPRDVKMSLALELTAQFHSVEEAKLAKERFIQVLSNRKLPTDLASLKVLCDESLLTVIVKAGFASSKSEARRLVSQKGVKINQELIEYPNLNSFHQGDVLQVGKKKFIQLLVES
jgi:tyrosyl-tRNA synthetase